MIASHPATDQSSFDVPAEAVDNKGFLQRVFNWLFGYDYFMAHCSVDEKDYVSPPYDPIMAKGNAFGSDQTVAQRCLGLATRILTQSIPYQCSVESKGIGSICQVSGQARQSPDRTTELVKPLIRPFAAKWHKLSLAGAFADAARCQEFRAELAVLQKTLRRYTEALADMANVEDLTAVEAAAR